jgi:hypothetical protein
MYALVEKLLTVEEGKDSALVEIIDHTVKVAEN